MNSMSEFGIYRARIARQRCEDEKRCRQTRKHRNSSVATNYVAHLFKLVFSHMVWKHQVVLVHFHSVHLEEGSVSGESIGNFGPKNGSIGMV